MSSLDDARAERDEAMGRAEAGASEEWKATALETIKEVARNSETFTSDDVWDAGLESPREPRALGPMMTKAAANKWIRPTGEFSPSRRRHVAPLPVWESLVNPNYTPSRSKAYSAITIRQDDLDSFALAGGKVLGKKDYAKYAQEIGIQLLRGETLEKAAERGLFGIGTRVE